MPFNIMLDYYSEKFSFIHSVNLFTVNEYINIWYLFMTK